MKVNGCERHTVEAVHTTQISIQWQFIVTANFKLKKGHQKHHMITQNDSMWSLWIATAGWGR